MDKKTKGGLGDRRAKQFAAYFRFSMIALCVVMVFTLFSGMRRAQGGLDPDDVELIQYKLPDDDAPVAVFETDKGEFAAVLYPNEAPNFVEYFTGLVNDGYYDGTYVFAVQEEVFFMGGAKASDGTDTDNTDKTKLEPELHEDLWPFKGALIAYGDKGGNIFSRKIMSGSRILFVDSVEFTDEFKEELDTAGGSEELIETFKRKGGIPNFSQQYTIFGQVYDGFEVYDEICRAQVVDEESLRPTEDIRINKAYMTTYGEHRNDSFFSLETVTIGSADKSTTDEE